MYHLLFLLAYLKHSPKLLLEIFAGKLNPGYSSYISLVKYYPVKNSAHQRQCLASNLLRPILSLDKPTSQLNNSHMCEIIKKSMLVAVDGRDKVVVHKIKIDF
jgi:hypothetical protein